MQNSIFLLSYITFELYALMFEQLHGIFSAAFQAISTRNGGRHHIRTSMNVQIKTTINNCSLLLVLFFSRQRQQSMSRCCTKHLLSLSNDKLGVALLPISKYMTIIGLGINTDTTGHRLSTKKRKLYYVRCFFHTTIQFELRKFQ